MKELPPAASAVLHEARRAHEPTDHDVERSLALLHENLSFGPDPVTGAGELGHTGKEFLEPGAAVTAKTGVGLLTAKLAKLSLVVAALSGAVGGVWWTTSRPAELPASGATPAPLAPAARATEPAVPDAAELAVVQQPSKTSARAARASTAATAEAAPGLAAMPTQAEQRAALPSDAAASEAARKAPVSQRNRGPGRVARTAAAAARGSVSADTTDTTGTTTPDDSSLAARQVESESESASRAEPEAVEPPAAALSQARAASELALIDRAALRLRDGDGDGALRLLDEHLALYPAGMLRTERMGLRVLSLCAAGRIEQARLERATFLRDAGRTPLAVRVRRACPPDPTP